MKINSATGPDFKTKHLVLPTGRCAAVGSLPTAASPARQPQGQILTLAPGQEGDVQVPPVPHDYFTENKLHYIKGSTDVEWKVVEHKLLAEGSPLANYKRQSSSPHQGSE